MFAAWQLPRLSAVAAFLAASLCLSASAMADRVKLGETDGFTLTFVFDSTGSMSDELRQVKQAMKEIFDYMIVNRAKEIADFAFVPFNDPGFGPATVTTNIKEYRASLDAIVVRGGDDCPEMAMKGIKLALEKSRPSSYLFVFTDASAKDYDMKSEIEALIQIKKSKVVFVLTGICNNKNDPGYKVYESIADISNGHVFNLLKNEVHKVLDFVKVDTTKKSPLASGIIPAGHKKESVPVDSSIKKMTVTATGEKPTIEFTDPTGKHEEGNTTLNISSVIAKEISNPMHGNWTVDISSKAPGRFVVAVESSFDFDYGFALNPTENILETSHRPLAGAENTLLIRITHSTNVNTLTSVVFKDTGDNELDTRMLIPVPGKKDVFVIDKMFIPPSKPFFLFQVIGIDTNNNTLTRTSGSGVTPQLASPPVITLPEEAVAVKGDPLVLKCHVESLIPFNAAWLKDSSEVKRDQHFPQSSEVPLIIENSTNSSEGTYTCRAKNTAGSSSKTVKVSLEVKPVLQEPESSEVSVAAGLIKELPCIVLEGKPSPIVTWYKDGEVLEREELLSVAAEIFPNGSLIFSYIKPDNEGLYECEAINTRGRDRIKIFLKALVPPYIFDEQDVVVEVMLGEAAQLPCAVHGDPKPDISWEKDNLPLHDLHTYGQHPRDDSLYIVSADYKHNGTYQCIASNTFGEARKTINVRVADKPQILPMEEHIHPTLGEEVTLNCEVEAFPEAEVKWFKNGVLLDSEDISYSSNNASLRLIAGAASSEKYECQATNTAGEERATVVVSSGVAPEFNVSGIERVIASVGDNVSLLCNTYGFPPPTYSWTKQPENTLEIGNSSLTFFDVQPDQEGIYTCDAQNDEGVARKSFSLKIYAPPEIRNFLEKRVLKTGSNFELQCLADGKPNPTISWLKDGTPIDPDSPWLYINNAKEDDAGLYTCKAKNYEGVDEKHLVIVVEVPPTMEKLDPSILEVSASKSALLSCPAISGRPPPRVQWTRDGRPVIKSRQRALKDGGKTLHLKKVTKHDAGVYTCVATNSHGTAQADLTVEVLQVPRFTKKISSNTVTQFEGISIDLDCSNIGGNPEPEVLWQRNGHPLPPDIISRVVKSENGHILTIVSTELTDIGLYECIVKNKAGQIVRPFNVHVLTGGIGDEGLPSEGTWGEWSEWSECSASCGHSEQVRTRKCSGFGSYCEGDGDHWRRCHVAECKVDGGWSNWSLWSTCPTSCGSGKRNRTRFCNNPSPQHGGNHCVGQTNQTEVCYTAPCPVDGAWAEWSDWRACTGPCPNGTQKRTRKCVNPAPAFGGKSCDGEESDYRPCAREGCPVGGHWSEWSSWSTCSATCGRSIQTRERTCTNPEPKFGGDHCEGQTKETRKCVVESCDKVPAEATINVQGFLNDLNISDTMANISISDLSGQRSLTSSLTNIFKKRPWFPYFSIVVSPVTWLTAVEKNEASNGFTLTKGVFKQASIIKFMTGEKLVLTHNSYGVNSDGVLQLDAHIQGSAPVFSSKVKIQPYKEHYIQTAPGELNANSHSSVEGSDASIMYSWNKNIKYDPKLGRQRYLSEVLSVQNINTRKKTHSESASIDKSGDGKCPKGFFSSEESCKDVDECSDRHTHICHLTQTCVNAVGTYNCECSFGFTSEAKGTPCKDIDECAQSPPVCSHRCKNLDGSFRCLCPPGLQLLDSNTTCTSIHPVKKTAEGEEITLSHCPPQLKEVEGFCQERNRCEDSEHMCGEDEVCLNIRGLYRCISFPCPSGHHRITGTKICAMECSEAAPCDSGAEISEKFVPVVISPEDPVRAYKDLVKLPIMVKGETERTHTLYRILENEKGKPFRVRIENGVGNLYSKEALSAGKEFRLVVLGAVYNDHEDRILHAIKFSVFILTPHK